MSDETIIKIETPEPEAIAETHAIIDPPTIVEPVIDMAVKLGEVCAKMEIIEATISATVTESENLKSRVEFLQNEVERIRVLATPEPEPDPIVEETPDSELPVETLPEIEIIPEAVPEVIEEVKKRKRFFV